MTSIELKQKLIILNIVEDNDWLDKYCDLVINNTTKYEKYRVAKHHIIPRFYYKYNNLKLDNSKDNISFLLHSDHILAHIYLQMCLKLEQFKYKNKNAIILVLNLPTFKFSSDYLRSAEVLTSLTEYQLIMESAYASGYKPKAETLEKLSKALKGRKKSEEFKQKLRNYYKNNPKIPYFPTEEEKLQISESVTNYYKNLDPDDPKETTRRLKISKALTGKVKPDGFSEQLSEARKGINNPMYGKKHTEDSLLQMSISHSGKNNPWYGQHLTDEQKQKAVATRRKNGSYSNYVTINNGIKNYRIKDYELDNYLANGWIKGGISRPNGNDIKVHVWQEQHPDGTIMDCVREINLSYATIAKYWKRD